MKVREGISAGDYSDPGWYENPPGTQAWEWTGDLPDASRADSPAAAPQPSRTVGSGSSHTGHAGHN